MDRIINEEPNVCEEQQLTAVGQPQPSVRAFTHLVSRWEQGCAPPGWCVGYERRTRYYTMYRQAYSMEQRTVYRCCPGWRRQDAEPGCQHSISAAGTCFNGRRCSDSEAQPCQCSEGFQGPRCQYDINECAVDNGGCQDQCCNTIGSYYCRCQAGRKLGEDGRGCEGNSEDCLHTDKERENISIRQKGGFVFYPEPVEVPVWNVSRDLPLMSRLQNCNPKNT
ncbi:EGF-like and EMI domain-containing protein 1 [Molossus nigricans]